LSGVLVLLGFLALTMRAGSGKIRDSIQETQETRKAGRLFPSKSE